MRFVAAFGVGLGVWWLLDRALFGPPPPGWSYEAALRTAAAAGWQGVGMRWDGEVGRWVVA